MNKTITINYLFSVNREYFVYDLKNPFTIKLVKSQNQDSDICTPYGGDYSKWWLVAFCSDKGKLMSGNKSSVSADILGLYPNILV